MKASAIFTISAAISCVIMALIGSYFFFMDRADRQVAAAAQAHQDDIAKCIRYREDGRVPTLAQILCEKVGMDWRK